jgi:hypothetical protein
VAHHVSLLRLVSNQEILLIRNLYCPCLMNGPYHCCVCIWICTELPKGINTKSVFTFCGQFKLKRGKCFHLDLILPRLTR